MLIVAIPKSASTSLIFTLAKIHQLPAEQPGYLNLDTPVEYKQLSSYHNDIVEITQSLARKLSKPNYFYKQHFPPTPNNIELLTQQKTILLLREPTQVLDAYYRAIKTFSIENPAGFARHLGKDEWLAYISESGLEREINLFYRGWVELCHKNILVVQFKDLISNPIATVNIIEGFWELPFTPGPFSLMKMRYTRNPLHTAKRKLAIWARKLNIYDDIVKVIRKFSKSQNH